MNNSEQLRTDVEWLLSHVFHEDENSPLIEQGDKAERITSTVRALAKNYLGIIEPTSNNTCKCGHTREQHKLHHEAGFPCSVCDCLWFEVRESIPEINERLRRERGAPPFDSGEVSQK